jgi:hypothetical protein
MKGCTARDSKQDSLGRAISQAVSHRLSTTVPRVRARTRSCGICGGQSCTRAGFLPVLRFPLPILIPPTAPHSSSTIRSWYNKPVSGRRGRAIAQADSRWLSTAAAWVRSRVWSSGICSVQIGAGTGSLEYFGFPCQSSFHQLLHNRPHLSSGAGTIGQKWPQYKGLSPTPLAINK